jgi:uncharacterized protein (TIGR02246 family)
VTGDDDLSARVRRLECVEAARNLHQQYAEAVDALDAGSVADLFLDKAELTTARGVRVGRDAIRDHFASIFTASTAETRHFLMAPRVLSTDDHQVHLRSTFLFVARNHASSIGWGTYDDDVDVSATRPLFAAKVITVAVRTDLASGWAVSAP